MSEINKKMFFPSDKTTVAYQTMLFPVDRTEVKDIINKMLKYKILKQLNTMSSRKKFNPKDDAISQAMVIIMKVIINRQGSDNYSVEYEDAPFNQDIEYNMNANDIRKGGKYFSSFKGCGHRTYIIEEMMYFVKHQYNLLSELCLNSKFDTIFDILYRMLDLQAYNKCMYSKDYIIHIFEKNTTKKEREEISTEWFETSKKPTIPDYIKYWEGVYKCDEEKNIQENEYQEIDDKIDEYIMNVDDYIEGETIVYEPPPVDELTSEECEEEKNIVVNQEAINNLGDIDGKRYYSNVDYIDMEQLNELEEKKTYYREKVDKMRDDEKNYDLDKYIKYTKKYTKYLNLISEFGTKHPVKWYDENEKMMWRNW